jgi:hypothetical protein
MLIESGTKWTLNQSCEFKVMNSLSTPRPKTKDKHCWYFVPCINIKEDEDKYAFNRILVQHGAKLKWETRRMGWCWFPSLNVYGMILVFFPLVLNHFSVEWKLFSKVSNPLMPKFMSRRVTATYKGLRWYLLNYGVLTPTHNILEPMLGCICLIGFTNAIKQVLSPMFHYKI